MDSLQQQQRREEQILSLFESIEDRELRRADPGEPAAAPDQLAPPWEHTDFRPPATPAQAPGYSWSSTPRVTAVSQASAASQLPVKRKRGRPPKNAALVNGQPYPALSPAPKPVEEEEDVCFICFDGGSLVLCDQKGCPKAYHPACIKRDESFFTARAKWMCGWHLCSTCEKGAYYMCYTCTYSLCKNCTKDADYVCVRGSKGLCGTCMKTIMLIENIPQENQPMVQVDFDDKTSWEYLFKVYWVILKEKLSLTISELTQAKNPWIEVEPTFSIPTGDRKYDSGSSNGFQSQRVRRGRKPKEHLNVIDNEVQSEQAKANMNNEQPSSCQDAKWASKELLEFVAHMKNGDTSVLSQFDVQALLLEYIRKNNLRDTKRKCQIVCDSRLLNLFGRNVVGHFEMLKLLNSHFLVKENPKIDGSSQVHNSLNGDNQPLLDGNKTRKTRKKVDERMQQVDTVDYAAADTHNISLIYLQRNMLEKLLDDPEKFQDNVVGSVVRIRVNGTDQTQEIHRLVRVVGTSRAAEPYKAGNKTAEIVLEIMNLEKKELRPIDQISNQDFSEDECGQLRESIKCGQIKWHTVGELLQTALKLQEVRVNQGIEAELLRLNHLRDRASENGQQKELRECAEKIQLLKSPEECQRRMQETPEVHTGRSADPNQIYSDSLVRPRNGPGRKRKQAADVQNSFANKRRNPPRGNQSVPSYSERNSSSLTQETSKRSRADPAVLVVCALKNSACKSESTSGVASEVSPSPLSTATDQSVNDAEIYKMWHYQDPTGKTQGPFTMAQLRKWNASGHFPTNLRIWRADESREDSILLIEALNGNYNKQEPRISSNERNINLNGSAHASPLQRDVNIAEGSPTPKEEGLPTSSPNPNLEENKIAEGLPSSEEQINTAAEVWKSLTDDAHLSPGQPLPQHCNSDQLAGNQGETKLREIEGQESSKEKGNLNLFGLPEAIPSANNGHNSSEMHSDGDGPSCQSSGQNWNNPASVTTSDSLSKSHETSPQNKGSDVPDIAMATVSPCSVRMNDKAAGDKLSMSSDLPVQHATPSWSSAPSLATEATGAKGVTNQWGEGYSFVSSKPVDEWDSTVGSDSSLTPTELPGNSSALTSSSVQQTTINSSHTHHSLPLDSSWQTIVNETNDFASLGEESVSDLLAEVEAMENAGLPSPTSAMKFVHALNVDGKDDCFSPIEGFDPTPGPAKSEVFTSTIDLMVTTQPTITTDIPHNAASNGDLADARRTSHKNSSSSSEPERSGKQQNVGNTVSQWKSEHTSEPPQPSSHQPPWQLPGTSVHTWGVVQGSSHWQGTNHSHTNTELESRQGHYQRTGSFSSSGGPGTGGSQGILGNQQRYNNSGSSRYSSPQDRGYQGTDQGYGRNNRGPCNSNNNSSSRQYSTGGSGSGYRQQTSKGHQRVCKFYEGGYCKKGASCSYLHP